MLIGFKQTVAPGDRVLDRPLVRWSIDRTAPQDVARGGEPIEDCLGSEVLATGGGQLERQGEAFKLAGDLRDGSDVVVGEAELRPDGGGAFDKEAHGI